MEKTRKRLRGSNADALAESIEKPNFVKPDARSVYEPFCDGRIGDGGRL